MWGHRSAGPPTTCGAKHLALDYGDPYGPVLSTTSISCGEARNGATSTRRRDEGCIGLGAGYAKGIICAGILAGGGTIRLSLTENLVLSLTGLAPILKHDHDARTPQVFASAVFQF